MSKHVSEWLNLYHDGELRGSRLHQVEAHLAECEVCQAELESFENLSAALHEVPASKLASTERFVSQVNLRMPHKQAMISKKQIFEVGWWMIPVGILASWIFFNVAFILGDVLSVAGSLGLLSGMSDWLASGPSNDVYVSTTIGQLGVLSGNGLNWAETMETFTRMSLPQITLQVSIALLYLGWIAVWWARRTHQEHGRLLEN